MSKSNILLKISGSIAAYKIGDLISMLVQRGYEVQTVASPSALKFIGPATLEGLSGRAVLTDTYESGKMMAHINLTKWSHLTILAPATANTINKIGYGLGEDLLSTMFLAHDWAKPYFLAPALKRVGGSIIGSRDKTTVPQCMPITFLLFKFCATSKASSGLV